MFWLLKMSTMHMSLRGFAESSSAIIFFTICFTVVDDISPESLGIALLKKNRKPYIPRGHERYLFEVTLLIVLSCRPSSEAMSLRFRGLRKFTPLSKKSL